MNPRRPAAVSLVLETLEPKRPLATFTVTSVSDSRLVEGSLPWAVHEANYTSAGPDVIRFNLPAAARTIRLSDTLYLNRYADTTIYVVRKDVTSLSHLEIVEEIAAEGRMPRPYIVMNAVRKRILGYGQGALYGYGDYGGGKSVVDGFRRWVGQLPSGNGRNSASRRKGIPQKNA